MPYIRRGEKATAYIPWHEWFHADKVGGQQRHDERVKQDNARAARALKMQPGVLVVATWFSTGGRQRLEIRGTLVRTYPYILPGIVVAVIATAAGQQIKVEASRVRIDRRKP